MTAPNPEANDSLAEVIVMKFGSSVLVSAADAPTVASDIYAEVRRGRRVIAVVSAFSGETDRLLAEVRALGLPHDNHLLPSYVVQGEERAANLVAVACDRIGLKASNLTVRELGLTAEGRYEHAKPTGLDRGALDAALSRCQVVVVPGFGAVSPDGRVVLLGRGGSDLTAVFIAGRLGLDRVQLVKDVDGLYDRDPNKHPDAHRYDHASWMEARALGAGLVQIDALEAAERRGISLEVRNYLDGHRTVIGPRRQPPRPAKPYKPLRIAVAGCGVVGGGALSRLMFDPRVQVTGVLVRDVDKLRAVPGVSEEQLRPLLTTDVDLLFARKSDILVEALSEADAGLAVIEAALDRGVDVAAASKQAVSRNPMGLQNRAARHGARVLWSASVGGGTPMIETLRRALTAGPVEGFDAVLNGTVNFMLERLGAGSTFDAALAEARAAGFAEEDPSADLNGDDAVAKVRLLAYEAFGLLIDEATVVRDRLSPETPLAAGMRQLASCRLVDGRVVAEVRLVSDAVPSVLTDLRDERNALIVYRPGLDPYVCEGRGAGRWATAESLLADVSDLAARRLET